MVDPSSFDGESEEPAESPNSGQPPGGVTDAARTHSERLAALLAGIVSGAALIGGLVLVVVHEVSPVGYGWFAYQPLAHTAFQPRPDSLSFWIGLVLTVVGALALGAVGGRMLWRR